MKLKAALRKYGFVLARELRAGGNGVMAVIVVRKPIVIRSKMPSTPGAFERTYLLTFMPSAAKDLEEAVREELRQWGILPSDDELPTEEMQGNQRRREPWRKENGSHAP